MKRIFSIKERQKNYILNLIKKYGPLTRYEIKKLTNIRLGTIGKIVDELKKEDIVKEYFLKQNKRGRRKGYLKINQDGRYAIGVELKPSKIISILTNIEGKIKNEKVIPISKDEKKKDILKKIKISIKEIIDGFEKNKIIGIGFVDPGIIDSKKGKSLYSSILPEWKNVNLTKILTKEFNLPVYMINTSSAKALAEHYFGNSKNSENFIYFEYGDGIACGLFFEGNLIKGEKEISGEIGHIKISNIDKKCKCGKNGCLEAIASFSSIKEEVEKKIKREISIEEIFEKYEKGDKEIEEILENSLTYLSLAISYLVNILNPEILIIDRNFKITGKKIFNNFVKNLEKFCLEEHFKNLKIKISELGENIGCLGGAALVIEKFFKK